jgi:hypothetical protein
MHGHVVIGEWRLVFGEWLVIGEWVIGDLLANG